MTVEPYLGSGAYGDVFGDPVDHRAYVEDSRRLVRDDTGAEVVSETTVRTRPDVSAPPGSRITVWPTTARERVARVITNSLYDHPAAPSHCEFALT
ncbi:hypothetical protein [Saccharopolyspora sp. 6V]|uniref:hypothetical protein n=1 Tax=Saccharopolyspora sp. 6V TaxID=2877239 RepID=UPI001CD3E10C|nr:hypothetical protein [Saccharopolyspora sp. 6V]MCA1195130.1 hypothetical protein [Saccharopolyspora sp. 6V]